MAYPLSATKLKSYARCPQAYYFRYECGLKARSAFASAALGTALHAALAQFYTDVSNDY
ncbi:PD-(D/E)XK nuclease family protein [Synechococcus sp. PCC 7335]|uniref:PD-(D/E)XK nuclease family protein n=1 Tax=Synechococcus sp. (strain ATCC 29403 / PCC 7335) TaxID=91464 RepID=UPI000A038269